MSRKGNKIQIGPYVFDSYAAAGRAFDRSAPNIAYLHERGKLDTLLDPTTKKIHEGGTQKVPVRGVLYDSLAEAADAIGVTVSAVSKARSRKALDSLGAKNLFS